MKTYSETELADLAKRIKAWGLSLGFQQVGISDTDLEKAGARLQEWLAKNYQGSMKYMEQHGEKRYQPAQLIPRTIRIISVRMDYLPPNIAIAEQLTQKQNGYISCYALGRDYHTLMRKRLQQLAEKITAEIGDFTYRAFTDSAPVMEKPIAEKAGLGWIGKHSNLLNRSAGSWFFLGELYTDLPLPLDEPVKNHCGKCTACIDVCPTQAIVAPYVVDARRCISYLTIENRGSIPIEFRKAIGNRIYGCDDCQLVCPWNRFAKYTKEKDFLPRQVFEGKDLVDLFLWTEEEFLKNTEGSAIRRIGYEGWLRNIAVALGNAQGTERMILALKSREANISPTVTEHVRWALHELSSKQ